MQPGGGESGYIAVKPGDPSIVVGGAVGSGPGMGRLTVEAILFRDYPVVQTNVMLVAFALVTLNLLVDLTYAWLDPRIRYS